MTSLRATFQIGEAGLQIRAIPPRSRHNSIAHNGSRRDKRSDSRRSLVPWILLEFPPCRFPPRVTLAGHRSVFSSSRRQAANHG